MKRAKRTTVLILLLILCAAASSCRKTAGVSDLALRMAAEEGRPEDSARIAELRSEIRMVDQDVEKVIERVREKGTFWRLLGLKYMDYSMWSDAAEAFDQALKIYPEHAALLYNRGLVSSQLALSEQDPEIRYSLFLESEQMHRRALEHDPRYTAAMYALAVLLIFELDRPQDARFILEDFLKIERSSTDGRFLLARVYLDAGMTADALNQYDIIVKTARSEDSAARARDLIAQAVSRE